VIRNFCFGDHCNTFQEYKKLIEEEFKNSKLNIKVEDVYVVPNYQSFFAGCIDPHLSRLHKEERTQLQWRFEAIKPSAYFPCGVKTTYRAYCSDRVVELVKTPKSQCISKMGSLIGLEPKTVYCRWYPSKTCDPRRPGVEGIYLLRSIPHVKSLPPCPFPDNIVETIQETLREVRERWDLHDNKLIRDAWSDWWTRFAPQTSSADQYLLDQAAKGRRYHQPLDKIIYDRNVLIRSPDWEFSIKTDISGIDETYEFPEVFALAMNSVVTDFNRHPPDPRTFAVSLVALTLSINCFKLLTTDYYNFDAPKLLASQIEEQMHQKISYDGNVMSTTGKLLICGICGIIK
jgi:hypothetical protein